MSPTPTLVWIIMEWLILKSYGLKPIRKQPKMIVSTGTKTFKNFKLDPISANLPGTCPTLTPFIY